MWAEPEKYKLVGAVIASARERAKVTQASLARRLGKPQSFISNLERGQRRIDVVELVKLAEAIGADPKRLFSDLVRATSRPSRR